MSHYNFGVKRCSSTKLWHLTCLSVGVLMQVQLLGAPPALKFGRAKNVQNLVRFTTTFEFDYQISLNWIEISTSGKRRYQIRLILR